MHGRGRAGRRDAALRRERDRRAGAAGAPAGVRGGPRRVHAGRPSRLARRGRAPAIPIAAAMGLLFRGLDIADDLTDGDLPDYWKGFSLADIQIVTLALLASLPQAIIDSLDASGDVRARMQAAIARNILQMIA